MTRSETVAKPGGSPEPPSWSSVDGGRFVVGAVLAGRYRIVGLLGRGGMGEVYRAEDLKLQQTVALKFLPEGLANTSAALARFHREVRVARQVSHPNVCRVFDFGEADGHLFLTMEFIDGEDLTSLLRRIGRLPDDKALEIARQLCAGLAAAHDAGVLHRDLKPANIMIDGRGRARLTDFGLAGVAEELRREPLAGTPAYMSPEQRSGAELTPQSDIFSLGLVLYEIFTGRPAFPQGADQEASAVAPPSSVVTNLDPAIDRVILRCLERAPENRPTSAIRVAAALPGGDMLAAALAAGETPSPEMVAAAPSRGTLSPGAAGAAVAGVIFAVLAVAILAEPVRLYRVANLETPPDVLEDRARAVLASAGWGREGRDSARGFQPNWSLSAGLGEDDATDYWQRLAADPRSAVSFWYRRSDRPLVPGIEISVTPESPPLASTGDALVVLDADGRLRRMVVVPDGDLVDTGGPIEWTALLEAAGFDPEALTPAAPTRTPAVFADELRAWVAPPFEGSDTSLRVEAAGRDGRVVSFEVVGPWTPSRLAAEEGFSGQTTAGLVILLAVFASVIVVSVAVARRNLRRGRGDRRGAARLGVFVLVVAGASAFFSAHHAADLGGEYRLVLKILAEAMFVAGFVWIVYVAIEPWLRRSSPQLLVSWSRLLAGDWKDPMVGRDLLLGGLLGIIHTLAIHTVTLLPLWIQGRRFPPNPDLAWDTLANPSSVVPHIAMDGVVNGLVIAFIMMTAYLILLLLLRRRPAATAGMWLLTFLIPSLVFLRSWTMLPAAAVVATVITVAVTRLGLLGTAAVQLFFEISYHVPLAIDAGTWYSPQIVLGAGLLIGLSLLGARLAVGERKLLPD